MSNPVFGHYEQSLIAEAVEKQYGDTALYSQESLNELYLRLQFESFEQMSICNAAAESLYQWLNNNSTMSMEQAVLVSKQVELIEKLYPGLYKFDIITTESHSDNERLVLVSEAFNPKILMTWAIALTVILGLIRFFSSKKSPATKKETTIAGRLEKIEKVLGEQPKTVEEVPKPTGVCTEKNQTAYKLSKKQILLGSLGTLDPNKDITVNDILTLFSGDFIRTSGYFWKKQRRYNVLEVFKKLDQKCEELLKHLGDLDTEAFKKDPNNRSRESIENTDFYKSVEKEIMNTLFGDRSFGKIVLAGSKDLPEFYALTSSKVSFNGVEYESHDVAMRTVSGDSVVDALDTKQRLELYSKSEDIFIADWSFSNRKENSKKRIKNREEWSETQAEKYERAIASVKSIDKVIKATEEDSNDSNKNLNTVTTLVRFYHNHKSSILKRYMELDIHELDFENAYLGILEHVLTYDRDVVEI